MEFVPKPIIAESYIPSEVLSKLICSVCSLHLSVFPISISKNEAGAICGRCKVPNPEDYLRDLAYEEIVQFLFFQCSHSVNGCKTHLFPGQLKRHEVRCIFRLLECPMKFVNACNWKGLPGDLKSHFEVIHNGLIMEDSKFPLHFERDCHHKFLRLFEDELFIVRIDVNSINKLVNCSVEHVPLNVDSHFYKYFITIKSSSSNISFSFPERLTFSELQQITSFTEDEISEEVGMENRIALIELFHVDMDKNAEYQKDLTRGMRDFQIDWDKLESLKCSVCSRYMVAPIIQCYSGHSMCLTCGAGLSCGLCGTAMNPNPNHSLAEIVSSLLYPCRYHKQGCMVRLKSTLIRNHEYSCPHMSYECPLRDTLQCRKTCTIAETIGHVEKHHSSTIMRTDFVEFDIPAANESIENVFLLVQARRVFKTRFRYEKGVFMWSVILVGLPREAKKFQFEIDLIDNSGRNMRIFVRAICTAIQERARCFTSRERYVKFLYDDIDLFVEKGRLCYRVRIHEE